MTINDYFTRIFVINLRRRTDRWQKCLEQFAKFNIYAERFEAYDKPLYKGVPNGNFGCTSSHRGLFELIAYHKWERVLILEDDFHIIHDDFQELFSHMINQVPNDWEMLYLGGGYGEPPLARVSQNVIRIGRMMTTSSYAVTCGLARELAPYICYVGPIDSLLGDRHAAHKSYIFQPRLIVQSPGYSDLTESVNEHPEFSQLDPNHETMV